MVYPNPAQDAVRVFFRDIPPQSGWLTVVDTYGRTIHRQAVSNSAGTLFSVRDWPAGLYVVIAEFSSGLRGTCRLVVAQF